MNNNSSGGLTTDLLLKSLIISFENSEISCFLFSKEKHLIYNNSNASDIHDRYAILNSKTFDKESFFEEKFAEILINKKSLSFVDEKLSFKFYFNPIVLNQEVIALNLQIIDNIKLQDSSSNIDIQYLNLLDNLPVHIWLLNNQGEVFWQNKALRLFFNLPPQNTITNEWINLIDPSDIERVNKGFNDFLNTKEDFVQNIRLKDKNGNKEYFSSIRKPILDSNGDVKFWLNLNYNTTEFNLEFNNLSQIIDEKDKLLKDKKNQISKFETNFFKAQKIETLGKLAGGIAHDFNNILLMISLSTGLIQMKDTNEEHTIEVDHILDSIKKGAKIASKLMTFAGKSPNLPEIIDLNQEFENMIALISKTLGDNIKLNLDIEENLWNIYVDIAYLENSIYNIIINSKDALLETIEPFVSIKIENFENYNHESDESTPIGSYVHFKISDNGKGISQENITNIFDPFFTTKEINTGLGLSVIYGFINKSQGKIIVESSENIGTDVHIYLPKSEEQISESKHNENKILENKPQMKVLVIEDDALLRNGLIQILESHSYKCFSANDAHSAFLYIKNGLQVDIIISDVMMPGPMNALEFYTSITDMDIKTPILYTSGYAENIIVKDGEVINNFNFLMKPYAINDLIQKIESIILENA